MPNDNEELIKKLIAEDRIAKAIDKLLLIVTKDHFLYDEVLIQSGRLKEIERKNSHGVVNTEEELLTKNKIRAALLKIIHSYYHPQPINPIRNVLSVITNKKTIALLSTFLVLIILAIIFFNRPNKTIGIEGDDNLHNTIIQGNENIINVAQDEKATNENISLTIQVDEKEDYRKLGLGEVVYDKLYGMAEKNSDGDDDWEHTPDYSFEYYDSMTIKYKSAAKKQMIRIYPVLPYQDLVLSGGPIAKSENLSFSNDEVYFISLFPNLDLKLVNNSDETIFFNEIIFNVENSVIDKTPLPLITTDITDRGLVKFSNDSWMNYNYKDCYIKYDFFPVGSREINYDSEKFIRNFDFDKDAYVFLYDHFGDAVYERGIDYYVREIVKDEINFKDKLKKHNLDESDLLEFLKATLYKKQLNRNQFYKGPKQKEYDKKLSNLVDSFYEQGIIDHSGQRKIAKTGISAHNLLSYSHAIVAGKLYLTNRENQHANSTLEVKFSSYFFLDGDGGGFEKPSYQYEAIMLKSEGNDYNVSKKISQSISPKGVDRFSIRVGAPKSSIHNLQIQLIYNDIDTLFSNKIELYLLYPRSVSTGMVISTS